MAEATSAGINPATANPCTTDATNQNKSAFKINEKSPKVMMLMGKVSNPKIGRIVSPKSPQISATTMAVYQPSTTMPGMVWVITTKAAAVAPMCIKAFISIGLCYRPSGNLSMKKNYK